MEKKRLFDTNKIVGTGLLTAILIVLQLLSSIIPSGVNLNLALVPITLGAILYGPLVGGFLGLICGVVILASPNTVTVFMAISPIGTVIACLSKTAIAGVLAGFVYKLIGKKHDLLGAIVASIIVPLINTLVFAIVTNIFFIDSFEGVNNFIEIFTILIGFNFVFEIITNTVMVPLIYKIQRQVKH